jgi:hypothetical protein
MLFRNVPKQSGVWRSWLGKPNDAGVSSSDHRLLLCIAVSRGHQAERTALYQEDAYMLGFAMRHH